MRTFKTLFILLFAAALLCSCSNEEEKKTEKGKIETMTEAAGKDAVRAIKTPIEKAQAAADNEAERAKQMDERNKE